MTPPGPLVRMRLTLSARAGVDNTTAIPAVWGVQQGGLLLLPPLVVCLVQPT